MSLADSTKKARRSAYNRAYYQANKERELERNQEWRQQNPEKDEAIRKRERVKNGAKYRARASRWYYADPAHKAAVLARLRERRRERREYLDCLLRASGCTACAEHDPRCLQFHHRDRSQKRTNVTNLMNSSLSTIQAEIIKCDILCCNCHRKADARLETAIPRKPKGRALAAAQAFLARVKEASSCVQCGEADAVCLEFHHEDADFKGANVGALTTKRLEVIVAELLKCCVLCSNCHARLHAAERRLDPLAKKRHRAD